MRPQTPYSRISTIFPALTTQMTIHNPAQETDVIWRMIEQFGMDRALAKRHLSAGNFTAHWGELRSYLRQAREYDIAASTVPGISAGLLRYYAHLQLAKCELLVHRPSAVFNKRIAHGLSYSPEAAKGIATDYLTVKPGVFSELYEVRTGSRIPSGTRLTVRQLVSLIPDVALEASAVKLVDPMVVPAQHLIARDDKQCWYVLLADRRCTRDFSSVKKELKKEFEEVEPMHSTEPLQIDNCGPKQALYESRWRIPMAGTEPNDAEIATAITKADLGKFLSLPLYGELMFSPGVRRSTLVPMTADLARYALTYYVSSLVRYKPSKLDAAASGPARWLLEAFVTDSPPHLLKSAYFGLSGRVLVMNFGSRV